jgi:DNA-binding LacI/PurR family transcriptional regulator
MIGADVDGFSSTRIDDVGSAAMAVRHLVNLGHRRIAIISGDPSEPMHFTVPLQRRAGYRAALEAAGIEPDREAEAHGAFTVDGGDAATVELLSRRSLPTAIFAESDEMAFGAIRALARVGLRVPADVSLIGFDNHPMADFFNLTTISQDVRGQGRQIAQQLVDEVTRADEAPPVKMHAPTQLVVRGTTAVLGAEQQPAFGLRAAGGQFARDRWSAGPASSGPADQPVTHEKKGAQQQ